MNIFLTGTLDDMMERLCAAITSFDSEYTHKIKPASPEQIQQLKNIINFPNDSAFPKSYLAFLETMGQDDGGLLEQEWDGFSEVNIDTICECYADYEGNFEVDPKCFLLFLTHWTDTELFLDLSGGENPPVFLSGTQLFSATFENYLFQMSFQMMCKKQYLFHTDIGTSKQMVDTLLREKSYEISTLAGTYKDRMELAMEILKPFSLQPTWFSDEVCCCFFGKDIALLVNVHWAISFLIGCNDNELLQKTKKEIQQKLNIN